MLSSIARIVSFSSFAVPLLAQQYAGDIISGYLPTINGAEVAFFRVSDPTGRNNNLTLVNYYSLGTNGQRIVESNIERALIVIPGLLGDPWNYEMDSLHALYKANKKYSYMNQDTVAVLSPYFPNGDDKGFAYPWTEGLPPGQGSTTNCLVWRGSRYQAGADNEYPYNSRGISSFHVLDDLVLYFDNSTLFPNLKQIVLVGHSLGGQMLHRYAAVGKQLNTTTPVVYWIGNPDSYGWLNSERPLLIEDCPTYDDYRYGYTNYSEYPMSYNREFVESGGIEAVQQNYASRQIAYAKGLLDFGNEARGCEANSTGENRYERFFAFLKAFPPSCDDASSTNCDTVDLVEAQHDNGQMFNSSGGQARLFFDNWSGNGSRHYDFGYPRLGESDDPYPNPAKEGEMAPVDRNIYAGGMTFQGCYANVPSQPTLSTFLYDDNNSTIQRCTSGCAAEGYGVAGLANGTACWCGNGLSQYARTVVNSSCRYACSGNSREVCGAYERFSLYGNLLAMIL